MSSMQAKGKWWSVPLAVSVITSTMMVGIPEANAAVASCSGTLDNPHHSHHVPGTANSQSVIKCSVPMTKISGYVSLARDDGVRKTSPVNTVWGKSSWRANAALKCDGKTHSYTATVVVNWTSPAGYTPAGGSRSFSKSAKFRC